MMKNVKLNLGVENKGKACCIPYAQIKYWIHKNKSLAGLCSN